MSEENTFKWHGYIHSNGKIQVKRFFSRDDIDTSSPFVLKYLPPIKARDRDDAIRQYVIMINRGSN